MRILLFFYKIIHRVEGVIEAVMLACRKHTYFSECPCKWILRGPRVLSGQRYIPKRLVLCEMCSNRATVMIRTL